MSKSTWLTNTAGKALALCAATIVLAGPAAAQMMSPGGGIPGGSTGGPGGSTPSQDKAVSFMGLEVGVKKIMVDPASKGFRVILGVRNLEAKALNVAFISPRPTIVDDMGNLYSATSIHGGVGVCDDFQRPAPVDGKVMQDTLQFVETGYVQARLALVAEGQDANAAVANDVVITGLNLPR